MTIEAAMAPKMNFTRRSVASLFRTTGVSVKAKVKVIRLGSLSR
jgi:hypothetical protein